MEQVVRSNERKREWELKRKRVGKFNKVEGPRKRERKRGKKKTVKNR